ncbi:MAG TPA: flippase [Planctomycetota bacterium]|nr:flippase [Planctomycetota bacterium]
MNAMKAMDTRPAEENAASPDEVSKLASGFRLTLFGRVGGRGIQLGAEVLLARVLGPVAFGLYAIGWTALRLGGLIAVLGLDQGVLRYASPHWDGDRALARRILLRSLAWALASGGSFGALLFAAAPWLAGAVFSKPELTPVLRGFAVAFPVFTLLRVAAAGTRVSKRMASSVISEDVGQPLFNVLFAGLVFAAGWRLMGAVAATASSFAVAAALALVQVRTLFPEGTSAASAPRMREMLAFSVPASLAGIFTLLVTWIDRLVIAYYRPAAEVGVYQAVSQIPALFAAIIASLGSIMIPMIADLHHRGDRDQLQRLYRVSTRWAVYACGPLFLVMGFAPRALLDFLFGAGYSEGAGALVILGAGQMVNAATGVCGALVLMTGGQRRWLAVSVLMFAANLALNLVLVARWGIQGAAAGTAATTAALYLWGLFEARRSLRLWPYDREILRAVVALGIGAACLAFLRSVMNPTSVGFLAVAVATSLVVPGAALMLFGPPREDREFLKSMWRR